MMIRNTNNNFIKNIGIFIQFFDLNNKPILCGGSFILDETIGGPLPNCGEFDFNFESWTEFTQFVEAINKCKIALEEKIGTEIKTKWEKQDEYSVN